MGRWKNPYIDLVTTKPRYLLPCVGDVLSDEERVVLAERQARFTDICCELCCGSGGHLAALAERDPHVLHVGFELRFKRAYSAALKAERQNLENLLVIRHDARGLPRLFGGASLAAVVVNFPDPWEKRRLEKFLLLTPEFIAQLADVLRPEGRLLYKTDHAQRFGETLTCLQKSPAFEVIAWSNDLAASPHHRDNIPTEFENLFKGRGLKIHFLEAKRRRAEA